MCRRCSLAGSEGHSGGGGACPQRGAGRGARGPGPKRRTAALPASRRDPLAPSGRQGRTGRPWGPPRRPKVTGTALQNGGPSPPGTEGVTRGAVAARCGPAGRDVRVGWAGLGVLGAGGSSGASGPLWVQRALRGQAGVTGGGAGQEQSQQRRRERHFSLGWCSWSRPWPQGSSGPAGSGPGAGLSQRPRWRWTRRHLAALPGPGGLRARLGHQDGFLPHLQDVWGGERVTQGSNPEGDCDGEDRKEACARGSAGTSPSNPETCSAAVPRGSLKTGKRGRGGRGAWPRPPGSGARVRAGPTPEPLPGTAPVSGSPTHE